ncbi:MAG TPA: hypothetical protein VIF09_19605 [Polyangiaceae bacterium]
MSDLTPDDDALLEQARAGLTPTADDHDRVRRKVLARVALGVGAAGTTLTASGTAGGMTMATVLKIVGVVIVASGVVGATVMGRERGNETAVEHASVVVAAASSRAPIETPGATAVVAPAVLASPASVAPSTPPTHVAPAAIPSHRPVDPPGPATVADEARLLREADAARSSGDAARALTLLEEHDRRYPGGVLVEERSAERVVVLCALGRASEARAAGEAFLREHPSSPLAARVRASCAGP